MAKKWIVAGALAAVTMGAGGTAFAGEIDGNGEFTPVNSYQAGSICSFSGLNDDPTGGGDPFQDGQVQNWGKVVEDAKQYIGDGDHGAGEIASLAHDEGPGTACVGYANAED